MKKTRAMRKAEKNFHEKKAAKACWDDPLDDKTEDCRESLLGKGIDGRHIEFHANEVLSVTIFKLPKATILGYRLNTQDKDIPWRVKHTIKEMLGYGDKWGFEAYPPACEVVDDANMYWVFIPAGDANIWDMNFNNYTLYPKLYGGKNDSTNIR